MTDGHVIHYAVPVETFGTKLPSLVEMASINHWYDLGDGSFAAGNRTRKNGEQAQIAARFYNEDAAKVWQHTVLKDPLLAKFEVVALFNMGFAG